MMEVAMTPPLAARVAAETQVGADFETFYRTDADRLRRALAVTIGDPQVAAEAVDEAMTRALARWGHVRQLASPSGWVYRVGLNWSISRWRRRRREAPLDDLHGYLHGPDPSGAAVAMALRTLPVDQRAVIVCRTLLEYSTAETAAALDVPEGTVKSRLARGLAALRAALQEDV
jgi:DNA-directed RNA polymerase specialized sigma24 family protein